MKLLTLGSRTVLITEVSASSLKNLAAMASSDSDSSSDNESKINNKGIKHLETYKSRYNCTFIIFI